MEPFAYERATQQANALESAAAPDARFVAGGTNLLDFMKLHVQTPSRLIDINPLPLSQITVTDGAVHIGSMVRNSDLAYHEEIQRLYPVLSQALLAGATPQIRNMATVGGNLMQRTRCAYFRDLAWPCNKRQPGMGCSAIDGHNRSHAVLGTSDECIAVHPSDMCVALAALDAVVIVSSRSGSRRIPIGEFHVAYGIDPAKETVLESGELITAVELPRNDLFTRSCYLKIRDRASFEFALAAVAAVLEIKEDKITASRIALGGVATKPWRVVEAEQVLLGAEASRKTFAAAAAAALKAARPRRFNGFKIELARRLIVRALVQLAETDHGDGR
jgi:xanthine dehydrogenase YagS FAD-binding subunit